MAKQTHKYDGAHYQVTLMNMRDGSVQGHAAGCADLTRKTDKYAEPLQATDLWDVETLADGWFSYNSDFLAEGGEDNAYDINWMPCTSHIPAGDTHAVYEAAFGEEHTPVAFQTEVVTHKPVITTKVGAKWTYIYSDGTLIAEVRNDQAEVVRNTLLHI